MKSHKRRKPKREKSMPSWQIQDSNPDLLKQVVAYTDGACRGPGGRPGGWGVVLKFGEHRKEISGSLESCTNNVAESVAIIEALNSLKEPCHVSLHSDSQIAMTWLKIAIGKGSRKQTEKTGAKPWILHDLREAAERHRISTFWVKGHSGIPENERCDQMADAAARSVAENKPPDDMGLRFQLLNSPM